MTDEYRVFYTDRVTAEIEKRIDELRDDHAGEQVIATWFGDLFDAIDGLYYWPFRYPVDEPESERRGFEIRKLTFRKYIVQYRVHEDRRVVEVMSFVHGRQRREA